MRLFRAISFLLCVAYALFSGCGKASSNKGNAIGVDESWFPLQMSGRENNVTGFSTDLLRDIGKMEKISLTKISVNWDDLVEGLHKGQYDAILGSIPIYVFNQKIYDFSELYLATGPVLVVLADSKIKSLKMLKDKEVAVLPDTKGAILLEKYPSIIIRTYDSVTKAFDDLIKGMVDGAIVDVLTAVSYCQDLYQGQLQVATEPLTNEGLRLITLHNQAQDLMEHFNHGLGKIKSSGTYEKLLVKWNLRERCSNKKD
ncbi:MAG TPA: transporter substrate-binding domain-containing protein [Rhabdochlamydiaceae bacterium]|jgi:polar amino acid transport system substrate-binding protein